MGKISIKNIEHLKFIPLKYLSDDIYLAEVFQTILFDHKNKIKEECEKNNDNQPSNCIFYNN